MKQISEGAFAKINLTLDVLDRREDGYHNLRSIMQTISLHDDVTVCIDTGAPWQVHCYQEILPPDAKDDTEPELVTCSLPQDADNLAWKAAEAFFARTGRETDGLEIFINKRIPMQAGLGGGSADAAAVLRVLNKQGILMKLAGYAGWNTSANSMGTVLAMIVNNMYQNNTEAKQNFLVERFIEDFGYGAVVRSYVTEHILPQWGMTYFWCEEQRGKAANAVLEELRKFVKTEMTSVADKVTVEDIFLPWSRMFEIGLKATYKAD